jgi:threonylcarbamoyladenosine tRNA methylthiotransferase MtaB
MKVYLDSIGCRLNQAEIEQYARQFRKAGHTLVAHAEEADLAVINTCAVTNAAASDSRQKIRQAARAGVNEVIVTGCWSTLKPDPAASLPGVSQIVPNLEKDRLVPNLLRVPAEIFEQEPLERELIPGARLRTRAFIKVQDGCNNRCTFCVTTLARGEGRSRPVDEIIRDVHSARQGEDGALEIVLTGVHLGSWGHDFERRMHLRQLVQAILNETDVPRLRLSSLEPWDLDVEFFSLWQDKRLCRHLHLPLQSGCGTTLRRMARKTTPDSFAELVQAARAAIPGIAITTDVITGFPGETDEEFEQSLAFIRQMQFAGGHAFTYSARPGTAAARMPGQVPVQVSKERNARVREAFSQGAQAYKTSFVGQVMPVLWESATGLGAGGWHLSGLTDNYLRVNAMAPRQLWNQITPVRLTGLKGEALSGKIPDCAGA